ncbi:MAG TPA: hypothetical protein VH274_07740 [Mycobacteriales bacterium]|jgi:hypothetical protein|nr:hypothetical protein [Mycobacteriales bacterium]
MTDLSAVLDAQQGIVSRGQALACIGETGVRRRLAAGWQVLFPGVYAAFRGPLSQQQRMWAAYLYAGENAVFTDRLVLEACGIRFLPEEDPDQLHVLLPWGQVRKSRTFVKVTRTRYLPEQHQNGIFPLAPLDRALIDFGVRTRDVRVVLGVLADAVQRRKVTVGALEKALRVAPKQGRAAPAAAIEALRAGVRSVPEQDFRAIAGRCRTPPVLFNPLLRLPSGRRVSPDALIEECGLVHEVNGRLAHADEDPFESMQERHDVMTTAGLTVLHNGPRRLTSDPGLVGLEWRHCARRLAGQGMPSGVVILRRGPEG